MHQKDAELYYYDEEFLSADDDAFIGDSLQFDFVVDLPKSKDGCVCTKCRELFAYAEPNQKDGTFKCFSCRNY